MLLSDLTNVCERQVSLLGAICERLRLTNMWSILNTRGRKPLIISACALELCVFVRVVCRSRAGIYIYISKMVRSINLDTCIYL